MGSRISAWKHKMSKKYRAVIMEDETLFEAGVYRFSKGRIWAISLTLFMLVVAGSISLVFFTPWIREQIPGYTHPDEYEQQQELIQKVLKLEDALVQRDSFLASFQRMSGGGVPYVAPIQNAEEIQEAAESVLYAQSMEEDETNDLHDHNHGHSQASLVQNLPVKRDIALRKIKINANKELVVPGTLRLIPPVDGIISMVYNPAQKHYGLDLAAQANALIRSVAAGHVILSEWSDQNGYVIGIMHNGGLISFYKHNKQIFKKVGTQVYAGEAIAVIGNSGQNTSGPHLHFELWLGGNPINPMDYFALN